MNTTGWHFWIDRGGTFTDVVGRTPDGAIHTLKLLSNNPDAYRDAAAEGITRLLGSIEGAQTVAEIRMGTTVATNALLERKGARTGLLLTQGFGDALEIANQDRPELFALHIKKAEVLYADVAEVDERIDAEGNILAPLNTDSLTNILMAWKSAGIESVAICLLHAWQEPEHEIRVAEVARRAGFEHVYASHEVSPLMKLIGRAGTTACDAYLSPLLLAYLIGFKQELKRANVRCDRVLFMQSHGGLVTADRFRGKDAVLSGPAGGVVGMLASGRRAGFTQLIGFDMGGTSTDVSLCDGEPEITTATEIAGISLRSPMIRVHTIAAGGGSLLKYRQNRQQVGPESAGAQPGPRAYGRDGPLTVTDANVLLGRIQPDFFPNVFGTDGQQPLNRAAVAAGFKALATEISENTSAEQVAEGFLRIAVENMANAIRRVSVARGINPAEYTLSSFGGAGGQHACRVAERLGIRRILLDPLAGVLSAWGMGVASVRTYRQRTLDKPLNNKSLTSAAKLAEALLRDCGEELEAQGLSAGTLVDRAWLGVRAKDTDSVIEVEMGELNSVQTAFATAHKDRFGFAPDISGLWAEQLRVESSSKSVRSNGVEVHASSLGTRKQTVAMYLNGSWQKVPAIQRTTLSPADRIDGPAIITDSSSTLVVEAGWTLTVNTHFQLVLEQITERSGLNIDLTKPDPVLLEILNNQFVYIAEEMGAALAQTARSVNIRERKDFSCALFTAEGELIANAPHVPVHLGSMDASVRSALRDRLQQLKNGATIMTNAPYNGGTHLPDITVISPVLDAEDNELLFLVAARAHHADIGGITPGSMPPFSTNIHEEGVLFDNFVMVSGENFQSENLVKKLAGGEWPARNPAQNLADLQAQLAANMRGADLLKVMLNEHGKAQVQRYAHFVQDNAEAAVRAAISKLTSGYFEYPLDNGQKICVRISVDHSSCAVKIDFDGTSAAQINNLNTPESVCRAAVLYVFRTLVQTDIPLNAGCHKPIQMSLPDGSMLSPRFPAAVVGGNVETSQCITNALYGALGILAASQGTMNNLSFGNADYQYYETIAGGAGAGAGFHGASAVQTHMTNTQMTDTEVLETRYPILVREFSVRRGSGGRGQYHGGDGVRRAIEFRKPMTAAILSTHRRVSPFGMAGGMAGKPGINQVLRNDGQREEHGATLVVKMGAGDKLIVETPGGGGYGKADGDS